MSEIRDWIEEYVTKREVIFSLVIIAIMLLGGFFISNGINNSLIGKYREYDTALQINNNQELFEYSMRTDAGKAFVHGELKCLDPVTYPEIGGKYSHVEKVKERYTMHTRIVTYTDGKGHTHTRTEHYWTWDRVDSWDIYANRISFLNVEFKYGMIPFSGTNYIRTIRESSDIRYKYYGSPIKETGTLYSDLKNKTINDSKFYNGKNIKETIEWLESHYEIIIFWVVWIILMIAALIGFFYIDNRWLE